MKARLYAAQKAHDEWERSGDVSKAVRVYAETLENFAATREELRAAREARSRKFGIGVKKDSRLTPPQGYPTSVGQYGDPVNHRYPAESYDRARAALGYFNQRGQREKGGYTPAEWAVVGRRLARLIGRHLPAQYEYKNGRLNRKEE